ncbi:MAG: hypothetical protein IJ654_01445 [Bacteroidales bacterium]|nr:hypothetical protein [Bacteroidales bacterium]
MKKTLMLLLGILFFIPTFANDFVLVDTTDLYYGGEGPLSLIDKTTPVVCDVNPVTGVVSITTTDPGPVFVQVTGQTTGVACRDLFYGATMLFLTQSDQYDILFVLPSGETYGGSFDVFQLSSQKTFRDFFV